MPGEQIIMSSNLPLLFVKGRPRSLETIELDELEEFVHFMILCSLKVEIDNKPVDLNTLPVPEWWPQEASFRFPLCGNCKREEKKVLLKKLVCRCYTFYNCEFYLKFSSELAERPISELKFQQNPEEKTTTILDADGQVLVKCRNENFCYDKRKTRRTQVIRTPEQSTPSPSLLTQIKRIAPLIDLTFESSEDETEVYFKEQPSFAAKSRKFKVPAETNSQILTRRRGLAQEEIVGTSKGIDNSTSKKIQKKKLLFENYRKQDENEHIPIEEPISAKISRKRKRNVLLPITRKKRRFEDFSSEKPEPDILNKDGFMARLDLAPQKREAIKLDLKIEGRRKLSQTFYLLTLTSQRGQALLARNDRFNMAVSLDRNNRFCGTHHQEEEMIQMCTRSSDPSQFFKNKNLIPGKNTATAKGGYTHIYKWPRRTKNVVYPQKGPSVKECSVELILLSEETINFWRLKKCSKATMTPEEWKDKSTICVCQKIPLIVLDDESTSTFKNKSSSTRCKCVGSKKQLKPQTKSHDIENNDSATKEIISPELTMMAHHVNMSGKLSCKNRTFSTPCDSAQQMNLAYIDEKETFCGYSLIHSEPFLSSQRVLHRRPLAVVPSEPITMNEELTDTPIVTNLPDDCLTPLAIKPYNIFRSLSDAIKWYTKDEPLDVSDRIRESFVKEGKMFGIDRSQENIKPLTDMTLPGSKKPIDYFKIDVDTTERDYCFERSSCGASKLVTRRGERHYVNREPCQSCFQGKDIFCVYEFIRQAKLAGVTLFKNPKQLKSLFLKYIQTLNIKD